MEIIIADETTNHTVNHDNFSPSEESKEKVSQSMNSVEYKSVPEQNNNYVCSNMKKPLLSCFVDELTSWRELSVPTANEPIALGSNIQVSTNSVDSSVPHVSFSMDPNLQEKIVRREEFNSERITSLETNFLMAQKSGLL